MTLHTVGPETMRDDEFAIGKGYQTWMTSLLSLVPLGIAVVGDTKWVIATGFCVALPQLHEISGRLHDLCIRVRRTNILIRDEHSK